MKKYNLIINKDKTENVKLKRDTDRKKGTWRQKKSKHLVGDTKDFKKKISISISSYEQI